ncbi:uncharacterized protein LOC144090484 isoform X1 [Stigmatopora argus]
MSHMQRNAEKRGTNQLNKSDPGGATRYDASKMTKFTHAVSSSRCRTPDQWGPLGSGVGHTHAFAVGAFDWTSLTATETFMQIDEGPIWSLPPNGGVSKNAAPAGHVPHGCIQKSCGSVLPSLHRGAKEARVAVHLQACRLRVTLMEAERNKHIRAAVTSKEERGIRRRFNQSDESDRDNSSSCLRRGCQGRTNWVMTEGKTGCLLNQKRVKGARDCV